MKKIYDFICFGALFLFASCGEDGTDAFELGTEDPVVTITALSPDYGYSGDEFDVIGENLAGAVDFVKVNIGENVAKVLSCTDERITVRIPEDATTGKISVKFFNEELKTDLMLRVLGKPSVESISKEWGFVGDLITFTGTELGTKAEDVKMIFGDAKVNAPVTEWSETSFTVQIPVGATSGKIDLMVYTQKVNTPVDEFAIRQHATLASLTPVAAYKGSEVTIKGTSFGTTTEGVKVLVEGVEAEVLSCNEEEIKMRIPVSESLADNQEVAVKVVTPYEAVEGELKFTVKATPVVDASTGVSPLEGYIGTAVTITGSHMPETAELLVAKFNEVQATVGDYQYKDGGIGILTVKVPNGVSVGNAKITLSVGNLQFYKGTFKVNSSPVMNSIVEKLVQPGESITIKGDNFGTDKEAVNAFLNEMPVEITSIKNNEVKIVVPADFPTAKDAMIRLQYADIPIVDGQTVNVMGKRGDVTAVVLENCQQPFIARDGSSSGAWSIPDRWKLNRDFYALIHDNRDPNGRLSLLSSVWGGSNINLLRNDKMYQVVTLPAGKYKFILTVPECNVVPGGVKAFGVLFGMTKGEGTLPDLKGSGESWTPATEADFIDNAGQKSYVLVSEHRVTASASPIEVELTVELEKEEVVTIGFVAYIDRGSKGANADITNISIERQ